MLRELQVSFHVDLQASWISISTGNVENVFPLSVVRVSNALKNIHFNYKVTVYNTVIKILNQAQLSKAAIFIQFIIFVENPRLGFEKNCQPCSGFLWPKRFQV